ncbi:amino acid ABC transporter ATP-binding/permease protein [Ponticoccus sp. (in: a-proteobacteria)]|uniref:amino acid ABC transporter ATP-binding/permease protein n=1 Tax=Ponticoccus sp. (in: a-proteobacteria) TaxID=1925025 RepID=UPI003AB5F8D3
MRMLLGMIPLLLRAAPGAMARGAALAVVVLVMGAALLGLSGWFITATGIAGLAGLGIAFDVFRPSAGVRFLALGRTAARYGERLLTHDAVLRALAALRVTVLRQQGRLGGHALARLRGEAVLTRVVSDVDALDGLLLRVVLPVAAGIVTQALVFAALWWLVGPLVALAVLAALLPASALVLWLLARATLAPSEAAEAGSQALRRGVIDAIRDREALILSGQLPARDAALLDQDARARAATAALDRAERRAGAHLSVIAAGTVAAALVAGALLLGRGAVDAPRAAIGLFVALALAETVLPLRRGLAEIGRMAGAARRLGIPDRQRGHRGGGADSGGAGDAIDPGARHGASAHKGLRGPAVDGAASGDRDQSDDRPTRVGIGAPDMNLTEAPLLRVDRAELSLTVQAGEAVALTGPSGRGKSTLLLGIAGLLPLEGILLKGRAPCDRDEAELRRTVAMLPQRSALMAGTLREALCLAADFDDEALWAVLRAVALDELVAARGGLEMRLGERGEGLSGGQARRLALARCLLQAPELLLLDEPTEGLDDATAAHVLWGVRRHLPEAALLVVMHRGSGHAMFDAVQAVGAPG